MDNLVRQPDGMFALTFKNYNNIMEEEVREIFKEFGNIVSIRKSSEQVPWIFVRYKEYDEAFNAYKSLQSCKRFEIRVATSGRKVLEQGSDDREKVLNRESREKGNAKGSHKRNSYLGSSKEDADDDDSKTSSLKQLASRRKPNVNDKEDEDEVEVAGSNLKSLSLHGNMQNKQKKVNNEEVQSRISSSSRIIRRSGSHSTSDSRIHPYFRGDEGPPKLVRATEFYGALTLQHPYESGLACRAVFNEVWANHPLRKEMELKEVVLANFNTKPTKREIMDLCSGVTLLHISIDVTPKRIPYCRVLVATEDDAEKLYELDGCEYNGSVLYVSSLQYILDELAE